MNKIIVTSAFVVASLVGSFAAVNSDPVLMTVNKRPVHKSEFEYLYHKNSAQQLQPQSLDEYVDMFVNYKLKVADAEAAGLDTTQNFLNEFNQFRHDLAQPYVSETAMMDSLVDVAYSHYATLRDVSHIMLSLGQNSQDMKDSYNKLDSLRNAIMAGSTTWEDVAARYSIDGGSKSRGGNMGWMPLGRFPWSFEDMAYQVPVGKISDIVNSGFGYHIIRVEDERPNPGEVNVAHILVLTRGLDDEGKARARAKADSLYTVLTGGADFADVAKRESQDPGSAHNGGDLGWFGPGKMVAPFDSASFAMSVGEISKPVETAFGYHILYKKDKRPVASEADLRKLIEGQIKSDDRIMMIDNVHMAKLVKRFNGRLDKKGLKKVHKLIKSNAGGYDSVAVSKLYVSDIPVVLVGKTKYPVKDVMPMVAVTAITDADHAMELIEDAANRLMQRELRAAEIDDLMLTNSEYRNLVNEYRDGILLFDRASAMVWDKASKDTAGLEAFFMSHRDNYKWDAPKYKGYVIMAANDSILAEAKVFADSLGVNVQRTALVKAMRDRFDRKVKVERVIAAKGDNPITDYLVFDGPKPSSEKQSWNSYYAFAGSVISAPQEAADVRSAVTTDYQNYLEEQWLKQLHDKYPVTINRDVLKTVK